MIGSQVTVDESILKFIKFGNGKTTLIIIPAFNLLLPSVQTSITTTKGTTILQNFFDSLPNPFSKRLKLNKMAIELNSHLRSQK